MGVNVIIVLGVGVGVGWVVDSVPLGEDEKYIKSMGIIMAIIAIIIKIIATVLVIADLEARRAKIVPNSSSLFLSFKPLVY